MEHQTRSRPHPDVRSRLCWKGCVWLTGWQAHPLRCQAGGVSRDPPAGVLESRTLVSGHCWILVSVKPSKASSPRWQPSLVEGVQGKAIMGAHLGPGRGEATPGCGAGEAVGAPWCWSPELPARAPRHEGAPVGWARRAEEAALPSPCPSSTLCWWSLWSGQTARRNIYSVHLHYCRTYREGGFGAERQ